MNVRPVILSGGSGTRLWPLSRTATPKQFLQLTGAGTMVELTVRRVAGDGFSRPVVVASASHAQRVEDQLGCDAMELLVLEPVPRNTAAAIAAAALLLPADELLLVLPSDHHIGDEQTFRDAVLKAVPFAAADWIVTFGITPDRPETGFGYIKRGAQLASGIFRAESFLEKPNVDTARSFCASGAYDWNAGIFLFRAGAFLDELVQYAPEILESASGAVSAARRKGVRVHLESASFSAARSISVDHAVLEKSDKVVVVPLSAGWSDVGSWAAVHDLLEKDRSGNAMSGEVITINAADCLIRSEGPLVAAVGVRDLVIVAMDDLVLVMSKDATQDVKLVVEQLRNIKRGDLL
ncbi:MAG TPA: mannose-1-phosphate guanylyltransferase/mannose-6-phosphate isomerase [Allosphingosinicella sp.]|jgi:mannose-1-phosphate guanylyltransferase/mannose-1-phosphate guanylyltransferase/mannose-6-phosphate isomerase